MGFDLTPLQAATLSQEAVEWLKAAHPLPESAVEAPEQFRAQFQAMEDVVEGNLIKKFQLVVKKEVMAGIPVMVISPPTIAANKESKIIYNIHGGGFVMGGGTDRTALYTAGEFGARVYSIEYSLSPEVKYPLAINQCFEVYKALSEKFGASNIILSSSSAGGQLAACLLSRIQIATIPPPAGAVFFTPTLDLTGAGDVSVINDGRDLVSAKMILATFQRYYLGDADPKDHLVSPIYFNFDSSFPPTVITTGTRDMMLSNAIRLDWKLRALNVRTSLLVGEGMWHGFNWEPDMPEAVACRREVYRFLETVI